jgi:hypothetical protein
MENLRASMTPYQLTQEQQETLLPPISVLGEMKKNNK